MGTLERVPERCMPPCILSPLRQLTRISIFERRYIQTNIIFGIFIRFQGCMTYIGQNGRIYRKQLRPGTFLTLPASSAIEKKQTLKVGILRGEGFFPSFAYIAIGSTLIFTVKCRKYTIVPWILRDIEEELFDYLVLLWVESQSDVIPTRCLDQSL